MKEKLSDPDWLREKYHGEELTLEEIGDICGVTAQAVHYRMKKHGVKTRSVTTDIPAYSTRPDGYTEIRTNGERAYHHRLLATLLIDDISDLSGMDVHHKISTDTVKPDYLGNLEVLSRGDHQDEHDMDHSEIGKMAWDNE